MRVAIFPVPQRDEPASFLALLAGHLQRAGVELADVPRLTPAWAATVRDVDAVHLHWLEYLASADRRPVRGHALTVVRQARLVSALLILRVRGVGVVWTMHNLAPHQPIRPRAESLLAQAVYVLADEVIVHSRHAAQRARERFRGRSRRVATVIPHANYVGAFPAVDRRRDEIRAGLGLPEDAFVYLALGVIRRYKRLPLLAEQFTSLEGAHLRLLVAGAPNQPEEVDRLRELAAADPRIVLVLEYVSDEQVVALHRASDAAILAYADVFSSGALLSALSLGVPVVAPVSGTARELFDAPAVEFFAGSDLSGAMARVRCGDRIGAARSAADRFPWSEAAAATVAAYARARRGRA